MFMFMLCYVMMSHMPSSVVYS